MFVPIGWGHQAHNGMVQAEMNQVKLPYLPPENCQGAYPNAFIADQMMCAGNMDRGGISACQVGLVSTNITTRFGKHS